MLENKGNFSFVEQMRRKTDTFCALLLNKKSTFAFANVLADEEKQKLYRTYGCDSLLLREKVARQSRDG